MSNTNKHKNSVLVGGLSLLKNSFVAIGITSLVVAGGLVGFDSIEKDQKSAQAAPISGSSTLGGANSVSLNKKYMNGASEVETLSANSGSTVTVRVKYNNTGNRSVTDAQIKDSLPAGFAYQTGSFKNCMTPTVAEEACDSLNSANKDTAFNNLIGGGLSPVAGMYDAASGSATGGTAPSATSGLLEIGKKSKINLATCSYYTTSGGGHFFQSFIDQKYVPLPTEHDANPSVSNTASTLACGTGTTAYTPIPTWSAMNTYSTVGKRYLNLHQCLYYNANGNTDWIATIGDQNNPTFPTEMDSGTNTSNSIDPSIICGPGDPFSTGYQNHTPWVAKDSHSMLGNRYFNLHQCTYYNTAIGTNSLLWFPSIIDTNGTVYDAGTNFSNTVDTTRSCGVGLSPDPATGYALSDPWSNFNSFDTLDTARGSGYMEYKMTAPTTAGTFGTGVTLASTSTSGTNPLSTPASDGFVSGSENSVMVGLAPTFGTPIPTLSNPLTGSVGSLMPSISLAGSNLADGTPATFTPAGSSTPITGTMQGGQFIPTLGSIIPTNSTLGTAMGVLKSTGAADTNIPTNFSAQGATSPLNTNDLSTFSAMNCGNPIVNSTTTCTFVLPANKTLPNDLKMGIGDATPAGSCTVVGSNVTCVNIPTGSQSGSQIVYGQLNGVKIATNSKATIGTSGTLTPTPTPTTTIPNTPTPTTGTNNNNGSSLPLTAVDFNTIPVICNSGASIAVNSKATCTFTIPDSRNLPNDFKMGIGDATPGGFCTIFGTQVTCRDVPTGSQTGSQLLYVQTGNDPKISTGKSFTIGNYSMLKCEAGKMSQNQTCVDCPIGFYCDGGSDVIACPKGMTTWYTGSRAGSDCSKSDTVQTPQTQIYSNNNGSTMVTTTINPQSNKTIRTGGINLFSSIGIMLITLAGVAFWVKSKNRDSINLLK